jgi:hypothetical protein
LLGFRGSFLEVIFIGELFGWLFVPVLIGRSKGCRSYKNGFVWHDLAEDDLVVPATDGEYVLKGSELVDQSSSGEPFLLLNSQVFF